MPDFKKIFADGAEHRRRMLQTMWPELWDALNGLSEGENRTVWCALGGVTHVEEHHLAVGRLGRMGPPICQECIDRLRAKDVWPLPAALNKPKGARS